MKYRHYSPDTLLVLVLNGQNKDHKEIDRIGRSKGGQPLVLCCNPNHAHDLHSIKLGNNLQEIQANLFSALRILDSGSFDVRILEGVAETEEGLAIMNRARKAAHVIVE